MKLEARYSDSLILHALSEWSMENDKLIQKIPVIRELKIKIGKLGDPVPMEIGNTNLPPTFKIGQLIRLDGIVKYIIGIEPALLLEDSQPKVCYQYTLGEEEAETPIWWSTDIKID